MYFLNPPDLINLLRTRDQDIIECSTGLDTEDSEDMTFRLDPIFFDTWILISDYALAWLCTSQKREA